MRTTLKRLLVFCVLGITIGLAQQAWQDWQFRSIKAPSSAELDQLVNIWSRQNGQTADSAVRQAVLRRELDERRLFKEALRLQLHKKDPVVLRRLLQDARFMGLDGDPAMLIQTALDMQLYQGDELIRRRLIERMQAIAEGPPEPVTEQQIEQDYEQFLAQRRPAWLYSFEHQFYRANTDQDAQAAYQRAHDDWLKRQSLKPGDAMPGGDAFLHGAEFKQLRQRDIREKFGAELAEAIADLPTQQWSVPLQSRYGWHLVRIQQRHPEEAPSLAEMRPRLLAQRREEIAQQRWLRYLQALRERYRVISS